jgi:PEP-CTERM motif-containing protein
MTTFRSLVLIVASLASLAIAPAVYAVPFSVTAASFTIGSGYGIDASEVKESATLLDVQFSTATFATQTLALTTVGDTATFEFGTITLQELNAHSGIVGNETDNLEVSVQFTFSDPSGAGEDLVATGIATGIATTGAVSDSFVDYTLAWNPLEVNFGTSGKFEILMQSLSFSGAGAQTQTATITLLQQTQTATTTLLQLPNGGPVGVSAVPEPATLALLGLGLTALSFVQRNRSA